MSDEKTVFFHCEEVYNTKSAEIIVPVLLSTFPISSVLDVGCGLGTWLKVFKALGVHDILGIEAPDIDGNKLVIQSEHIIIHDLEKPIKLKRDFDLVLSLEVAEHLPENSADIFVETLISHGKVILFSAAIPGQGGQNHINEQWPNYWQNKFKNHDYFFYDLIRPVIWENEKVDLWYKQNIFLVIHSSIKPKHPIYNNTNLIHPDYWLEKNKWFEVENNELKKKISSYYNEVSLWKNGHAGIRNYFRLLLKSIRSKIIHILSISLK